MHIIAIIDVRDNKVCDFRLFQRYNEVNAEKYFIERVKDAGVIIHDQVHIDHLCKEARCETPLGFISINFNTLGGE